MITRIRHGVEPLKIHAAVAEMGAEAAEELKGPVVCLGSKNTHDPEGNKAKKRDEHLISVETYWEEAPKPVAESRARKK